MSTFDQQPAQAEFGHPEAGVPQAGRPESGFSEAGEVVEPVEILPTMADLDRLAADLDRVDLTLVEIDGPASAS